MVKRGRMKRRIIGGINLVFFGESLRGFFANLNFLGIGVHSQEIMFW